MLMILSYSTWGTMLNALLDLRAKLQAPAPAVLLGALDYTATDTHSCLWGNCFQSRDEAPKRARCENVDLFAVVLAVHPTPEGQKRQMGCATAC